MTTQTPSAPSSPSSLRDGLLESAALALALFAITLLAWSAIPYDDSGLATYAVSDSLARYGRWDIDSVRWLGEAVGRYGVDGRLYRQQGPALSVLAVPLVWLGLYLPDIGPLHAAFLLMPLLHTLTGVYLYHAARRTFAEISRVGALHIAALWAFGSPALPYMRTFSTEPLVALALIAALFHLLRFRDDGATRDALLVGFWLGMALLAHPRYAVVISFFALGLLLAARRYWMLRPVWQQDRPHAATTGPGLWSWISDDWLLARVMAFGLPILTSTVLYHWYNLYRFDQPFDGLLAAEQGIAYDYFLFQTLFSPGGGLVWYAPWVLLLVLLVLPRFWQEHGALASLVLGLTATILFVNSHLIEPDARFWGTRYVLPTLPLFALLVTPLWGLSLSPVRLSIPILGIIGFIATVAGVVGSFEQLPLQPAWMIEGTPGMRMLALLLFMALVATAVTAWVWSRQADHVLLVAGTLLVLCGLWLYLGDLRIFQAPDLTETLKSLPAPLPAGTQIWYDDPDLAVPLLNEIKAPVPIRGFVLQGENREAEAQRAQRLAQAARGPIYVITGREESGPGRLEQLLQANLFFVTDRGSPRYRIAEYWQGTVEADHRYEAQLGFSERPAVRLRRVQLTPQVVPGGILALETVWMAERALANDYRIWLQLRNDEGQTVLERDGWPVHGEQPTSSWVPGDAVVDRRAFRLPVALPSGAYTLHLGLYRPDDRQRATLEQGGEAVTVPIRVE